VARLHDAGLSAAVSQVPTDDPLKDGRVVRQSPSGGTRVPRGSAVAIDVGVFEEPAEPTIPEP
jgi:beta-lactam-binding protein with PASTA domain